MKNFRALMIPTNGQTIAIKTQAKDFVWNGGQYNAPKNSQINTWRIGLRRIRYAVYTQGIPAPWNLAGEKVQPDSYTAEDVLTVKGKYLSNVIRDALEDEARTESLLWIAIIVSGVSMLISAASTFLIYKVAKFANVI